ncbi:hypothetical protein C8J56DRAFT_1166553 [Mycena floridula]|nr:hypothetical protein C8J56DRAFT_1166553 [Mycena floridula]
MFCMDDEHCIEWSITAAPFGFQLVCSTWRNTVLATPQLWASLSLDIIPGTPWKRQLDTRRLELRIHRRNHRLFIELIALNVLALAAAWSIRPDKLTPPIIIDISSKAPRRSSISFQCIYQDPRSWTLPSSNLTEFRSQFCLDVQDVLKLLGSVPLLESVAVRTFETGFIDIGNRLGQLFKPVHASRD